MRQLKPMKASTFSDDQLSWDTRDIYITHARPVSMLSFIWNRPKPICSTAESTVKVSY